ncbi:membrane carboxypeptidase/penicillin-binding protein PbpC [Spirochaeta africana DSM 8902]|uniref:peptidoglycan glycosyltransferase n=2 Tax=Spirochaeta TaxID=146 RepID=H9UGB1_SPIAZ|nr:membrane carboxypeptidase/penicillin-binding protein PbpC [Spirochaeta africana DSM 8902]
MLLAGSCFGVVLLSVWLLLRFTPFPELQQFLQRPFSTLLVDRYGEPLRYLHPADGTRRIRTELQDLPAWVPAAVIAAEDRRFMLHYGIDGAAVLRAASQNIRGGGRVSGASTISMQLARLAAPHRGGLRGKAAEAWNAMRLEARYSKHELLQMYLNALPFGSGVEGIESASRRFFGVSAAGLSPEEAVLLAVIPRRPASLNPHSFPERAVRTALPSAAAAGVNADEQMLLAAIQAGQARAAGYHEPFEAPHLADRISRELTPAQRAAGGSLRTTLDLELQHRLEDLLYARLRAAGDSRIHNGAALVLDHHRGEVLAYVGSHDYFDDQNSGMIDAVRIRRQPGSTLKPFLYALALEAGFTAATILPDTPQAFGAEEAYIPQNFSRRFAGPVRLRTALSSSLNIPAVHTVVRLGVGAFADHLEDLGFSSVADQRDRVGAGIALGNVEVSLLELATAFSVFAGDGNLPEYRVLLPTDHTSGPALNQPAYPAHGISHPHYDAATVQIIRDILADQADRVLGFGADSVLNTSFPSIAKTGTANQFSNIWALAADPDYTVGVWMGNIHGETVIGRPGSSLPATVAMQLLQDIHETGRRFPPADAVHQVRISPISGMRYDPPGGGSIPELFPHGEYPPEDTWHSYPGGPIRYPPEYQDWVRDMGFRSAGGAADGRAATRVRIQSPNDGARFYRDPYISERHQSIGVVVTSDGQEPIQLYWNDSLAAEGHSPLRWQLPVIPGRHRITAVAGSVQDQIRLQVGASEP